MVNLHFAVYSKTGTPDLRARGEQHAVGRLRRHLPDAELRRPRRPPRPVGGPLDPHPVHGLRPSSSSASPSPPTPDPSGPYFRYAFPVRPELPARTTRSSACGPTRTTSARASSRSRAIHRIGAYARRPRAAHRRQSRGPPSSRSWPRRSEALQPAVTGCCRPTSTAPRCRRPAARTTSWARWTRADRTAPRRTRCTFWKFHVGLRDPANSSFTLTNTIPIATFDTIVALRRPNARLHPAARRRQPGSTTWATASGRRTGSRTATSARTSRSSPTSRWRPARARRSSPASAGRRSAARNASPIIFQEGTFAPGLTDGIHRWMGSIAQDRAGNMALGYSVSNATVFPGVRYTGRLVTDPRAYMAQGEGIVRDRRRAPRRRPTRAGATTRR